MNKNLNNYAQWCQTFDKIQTWEIGHIDNEISNKIKKGTLGWTSGVAERFTQRLLTLINFRLDKLEKFYNERIRLCNDQFSISGLLVLFRKELIFLKELASINVLPEAVSRRIANEIEAFALNVHDSLLKGAKQDLSGILKQIILDTKINNI